LSLVVGEAGSLGMTSAEISSACLTIGAVRFALHCSNVPAQNTSNISIRPSKRLKKQTSFRLLPDGTREALSKAAAKLRLLKKLKCTMEFEKQAWAQGATLVAGVDEVGRGCLFGPVVAAAVVLTPDYRIRGLRDSKLIPAATREKLAERIREHAIGISIAAVDVETIDRINIYHASRLAMLNAVAGLAQLPDHLLVDAMVIDFPSADARLPQTKIIHGDARSASIAAASIVAKVHRDQMIRDMAPDFPHFDLASNKGYRSPKHIAALREHGPSALHRRTFAPVWMAENGRSQSAMEFLELDDLEMEEGSVLGVGS
jgi:ribonuclease HII